MKAKTLMVVGTSSSAGKSLLVTALCHSFARRGIRVAPFKAQNMSNNAAVCPDGSEIGRAQAVQAAAAGLEPAVDMNPVLIKPEADSYSQVVVMGKPWRSLSAREYYPKKDFLWKKVTASLDRLRADYDLVIIEGAGSAAELNLRKGDIVNMAVALHAQSPVLLVGDIDRGGIFAQLLGTLWLLPPEERKLIKGLIVNKFRGDITLFEDGIDILEKRGDVPVLGVAPYMCDLQIPEEDAVALEAPQPVKLTSNTDMDIVVVRLPRIANFDDFDPLMAEAGARVRYLSSPQDLGNPQAIIIPGTKSTMNDLDWMRAQGWDEAIKWHASQGGAVIGICGGYQMLGLAIQDPKQAESKRENAPGLGLLPIKTIFSDEKDTHQARAIIKNGAGWMAALEGKSIAGYEIHMGRTVGENPWLEITERSGESVTVLDGAISADGRIWGCYIHGLFDNASLRRAWLTSLGWAGEKDSPVEKTDPFAASLTYLADTIESALDMEKLEAIIWDS